jgi:hypothetical protein
MYAPGGASSGLNEITLFLEIVYSIFLGDELEAAIGESAQLRV